MGFARGWMGRPPPRRTILDAFTRLGEPELPQMITDVGGTLPTIHRLAACLSDPASILLGYRGSWRRASVPASKWGVGAPRLSGSGDRPKGIPRTPRLLPVAPPESPMDPPETLGLTPQPCTLDPGEPGDPGDTTPDGSETVVLSLFPCTPEPANPEPDLGPSQPQGRVPLGAPVRAHVPGEDKRPGCAVAPWTHSPVPSSSPCCTGVQRDRATRRAPAGPAFLAP